MAVSSLFLRRWARQSFSLMAASLAAVGGLFAMLYAVSSTLNVLVSDSNSGLGLVALGLGGLAIASAAAALIAAGLLFAKPRVAGFVLLGASLGTAAAFLAFRLVFFVDAGTVGDALQILLRVPGPLAIAAALCLLIMGRAQSKKPVDAVIVTACERNARETGIGD